MFGGEDACMMPLLLAESRFAAVDWLVVSVYLGAVIVIGVLAGRRSAGKDEFFLAGRAMPVWAVAISVLATSQSAATFVGVPARAYRFDLTYLSANAANLIAAVVVAAIFLPVFYRRRVTSVYEVLGQTIGSRAQRAASAMFMIGRVFASGARLFLVAIPFALVAFGSTAPGYLIASIALIALAGAIYTAVGGIRAVIWTDVLQALLYVSTVVVVILILWSRIPASFSEVIHALGGTEGGSKLKFIDTSSGFSRDPDHPGTYSIWAIIFGLTLLNIAAFGCDQDLAQRTLTCKSSRRAGWSLFLSQLVSIPIVFVFLCLGLLFFVFYQNPDLMGEAAPSYTVEKPGDVFVTFILNELPMGLRGLMTAGLFAAAMSSLDSALNAMASTTIADFVRPARAKRDQEIDRTRERRWSRMAIVVWAAAIAGFSILCVYWQRASDIPLVDFALMVMVFAYSGLLAVFLTVMLTRRGNSVSVIAALLVGFGSVLLMQDFAWNRWTPEQWHDLSIAFGWQMLIATTLSFLVCIAGRRRSRNAPAPASTPTDG